jgi:hypothetical protein
MNRDLRDLINTWSADFGPWLGSRMNFNLRTYPLETALHGFEQFRYRFRLVFPESPKRKLNGSRGNWVSKECRNLYIYIRNEDGMSPAHKPVYVATHSYWLPKLHMPSTCRHLLHGPTENRRDVDFCTTAPLNCWASIYNCSDGQRTQLSVYNVNMRPLLPKAESLNHTPTLLEVHFTVICILQYWSDK